MNDEMRDEMYRIIVLLLRYAVNHKILHLAPKNVFRSAGRSRVTSK